MSFSETRKRCNKCGYDGTYYIPKYHFDKAKRKRCNGIFLDTEIFDIRTINIAVLKYLVANYADKADQNTRLAFQNSIMYALGAQDQEQKVVKHFWAQFSSNSDP